MTAERRAMLLLIVLSGTIISICIGLRQSLGIFMRPMTAELGITAAAFGFSIALSNIVWGLAQPFAGAIADKHGPRLVLVVTALVYAAGLLLMLLSKTLPGALEFAGFLTGVGTAGAGFGVLLGTVSRATPPEKRSQTVGIVAAAGSLGTMIIAPLGQALIDGFGWRTAMVAFAVLAGSIALLALPIREPRAPGNPPREKPNAIPAVREALAHRGYVFMTLAFFACGFQLVFITTHLPLYLQLCGVAPGVAASALALIGLFNIIGTLSAGALGGRFSKKYLLSIIYATRGIFISLLVFLPLTPVVLYTFAVGIGLLWLGTVPLTNGLVGQIFGMRYAAMLASIVFFGHQIGSFIGVWLAGYLYDTTGSYSGALICSIGLGIFAMLVNLPVNERPLAERRAAAAAA